MKVSVVIPVYNAARTIKKAVQSILNGSFKDFEIILVDDGSTDESYNICFHLAEESSNIRVLTQQNRGAAAARNLGIEKALGKYIGFVDSDDCVTPLFLERMVEVAECEQADIVWCNFRMVHEDGSAAVESKHKIDGWIDTREFLSLFYGSQENIGSLWSKLYRKSFLQENSLLLDVSRVYGEDWDFNLRAGLLGARVYAIPDVLYTYVRYSTVGTVSTRYYKSDYNTFCDSHILLLDIAHQYGIKRPRYEQNSLFIYNVVYLLYKLNKSLLSDLEKRDEYQRILTTGLFLPMIKSNKWNRSALTVRQLVTVYLIKIGLYKMAWKVLSV